MTMYLWTICSNIFFRNVWEYPEYIFPLSVQPRGSQQGGGGCGKYCPRFKDRQKL